MRIKINNAILFRLFGIRIIGKRIKNRTINKDGGMQESLILREFNKNKYNVDVGMYSYGGCFSSDFALGGGESGKVLFICR